MADFNSGGSLDPVRGNFQLEKNRWIPDHALGPDDSPLPVPGQLQLPRLKQGFQVVLKDGLNEERNAFLVLEDVRRRKKNGLGHPRGLPEGIVGRALGVANFGFEIS